MNIKKSINSKTKKGDDFIHVIVTPKKKIGFVSAILLVIGSSIGAGIFIKNHEILNNVHGSIFYAILAWAVAIFGIVALALALPEICSGIGRNRQGLVGWVRKFTNKFFYMGAKNFMSYLHLPIYFYVMPFYMVMTLQEAFGFSMHWYVVVLISLGVSTWFIWVSGLSSKAANIQNWVVTLIKFMPLAFAAIIGFVMIGIQNGGYDGNNNFHWFDFPDVYDGHLPLFADRLPFIGVMSSVPAVFFAFDGFYSAAGVQSEMKEPRKVSMALAIGIAIVAAIDVIISFSLLLGTDTGRMSDLLIPRWIIQVADVMVAIGILGIINGVAIYSSRYYEDLVKHNEIPFSWKFRKHCNQNKPVVGTTIAYVITLFWFVVFTIISLFFLNTGHYDNIMGWDANSYDVSPNTTNYLGNLYSFIDLIGNWNAVLAFVCIIFATIGAMVNRRKKLVKVKHSKTFMAGAIISTLIVGMGIAFVFIDSVGDFVYVLGYFNGSIPYPTGYDVGTFGAVDISDVIGSLLQIIVAFVFIGAMFIPAFIRCRYDNKKGIHKNSHKAY